jgi:hypothetical protein
MHGSRSKRMTKILFEKCTVCLASPSQLKLFKCIDGVDYFECDSCGSIVAEARSSSSTEADGFQYNKAYWENETSAARERSFGASINRCAEVFLYSRIPLKKFLDIGTGPGYLLDALSVLMPDYKTMFYGVELFPPPVEYRSTHENYIVGDLADVSHKFSGGVCIEVIEHLTPEQLRALAGKLAKVSEEGAVYYFNSAQPDFVKNEDPGYLDPLGRGHIASYSILGLSKIFSAHGFTIIPLPGRTWGFLAEFKKLSTIPNADDLLTRLWNAHPDNIKKLKSNGFGELMYAIGLESARCYLEHAIATERTRWALSLSAGR